LKHWKTHSGYLIYQVLGIRCNAYLLTNGVNQLLIDCGGKRYKKQLTRNLSKLGITKLDALILTHSHFDHAGNANFIQERFGCAVIIHEEEAQYLLEGDSPLPAGTNWITKLLVNFAGKRVSPFLKFESCRADLLIGARLSLENFGFKGYVLHTPGHSRGSVSIVVDEEIVLAGDTLFGIFPGSIFPPFADYPQQLPDSWKLLLETNSKEFFPSHGSPRSRKLIQMSSHKRENFR
jgi:hydroxyacylglutathione hydrolase